MATRFRGLAPCSAMVAVALAASLVQLSMASAPAPTAAGVAALKPLPKCPLLFQLNTRVILDEITAQQKRRATLDDFPDKEIDEIAKAGYDFVYFLGVWQTGDYGIKKSLMVIEHDACCKGLPKEAACSSPFAVTDYSTHVDFGGDEALLRLRDRLHARGLRLMVDFVPNHMAVDHPWTKTRPELLVQGSENSLSKQPQNFFKVGNKVFAHGKDMYYDGWTDTVQINYGNPAVRKEMCDILRKIAGLADGVRCDMAMLICEDVLEKTWGARLAPFGQERATGQFWPPAIRGAREVNKGFTFVAECYWEREYELQQFGFDYCYDKKLYDRLKEGKGKERKLVRFLENHDEDRAAHTWPDGRQHLAAAAIAYSIPGLRFVHDGQQLGRVRRISMHVNRRLPEAQDVRDTGLRARYNTLLSALAHPALRDGEWAQCRVTPSQDGNPSFERIVAHCLRIEGGAAGGPALVLAVVNYAGDGSNGHVILPACLGRLRGRKCRLVDLLAQGGGGGAAVEKEGGVLLGDHGGYWVQLGPWEAHIYNVEA